MSTNRLHADLRREELLRVALDVAERDGWANITHASVAAAAGVSAPLVVARLGTKTNLLRDVMRRAVSDRRVRVVAEGLARGNTQARKADEALRVMASEWVRDA